MTSGVYEPWMGQFRQLWRELKDPRDPSSSKTCTIEIEERPLPLDPSLDPRERQKLLHGFWQHNCFEHLKDCKQPWEDLFTKDDLSKAARDLADSDGYESNRLAVLASLAAVLEDQVRDCLNRPLALLYDLPYTEKPGGGRKWNGERWLLLLPVGAMFRVISIGKKQFSESCYFPVVRGDRQVSTRPPDPRWLALIEYLVTRFAGVGRRLRSEDEGVDRGPTIRPGQECRNIRFVTPCSWGFVKGFWRKDAVWGSEAPSRTTSFRHRLGPLPRPGSEEE